MVTSWIQTIPFYYILQNFSPFYLCSIAVSVLAVFLTWYFTNTKFLNINGEHTKIHHELVPKSYKDDIHDCELHVMSKVKRAKQKAIEKILTDQLSEEQLQNEEKVVEKQLSEIFHLLQKQEEKFQINSKEELHEQFKLYKNQ